MAIPKDERDDPRQEAIDRRMESTISGPFVDPGDPGWDEMMAGKSPSPMGTGPFDDPLFMGGPMAGIEVLDPEIQAVISRSAGQNRGMQQVNARLPGGGGFFDPRTGQPAQFGTGRFLNNPASFFANANPADDLNRRMGDMAEAVKRRLEELINPPGFASPQPSRGRFGF